MTRNWFLSAGAVGLLLSVAACESRRCPRHRPQGSGRVRQVRFNWHQRQHGNPVRWRVLRDAADRVAGTPRTSGVRDQVHDSVGTGSRMLFATYRAAPVPETTSGGTSTTANLEPTPGHHVRAARNHHASDEQRCDRRRDDLRRSADHARRLSTVRGAKRAASRTLPSLRRARTRSPR